MKKSLLIKKILLHTSVKLDVVITSDDHQIICIYLGMAVNIRKLTLPIIIPLNYGIYEKCVIHSLLCAPI